MTLPIHLILAATPRGEIGFQNTIPWKLKGDLKRFKDLTMDNFVLMGRKTVESLTAPLKGRIVVAISSTWYADMEAGKNTPPGVDLIYSSLQHALDSLNCFKCSATPKKIFIAGGVRLYEEAWNLASHLHLSLVFEDPKDGAYDAELPQLSTSGFELIKEPVAVMKEGSDKYSYIYYEAARHVPGEIRRPYLGTEATIFEVMGELVGLTNEELMIEQNKSQEAMNNLAFTARQRLTASALEELLATENDPNQDYFNIWTGQGKPQPPGIQDLSVYAHHFLGDKAKLLEKDERRDVRYPPKDKIEGDK
jgi:dihydrofolate reductase